MTVWDAETSEEVWQNSWPNSRRSGANDESDTSGELQKARRPSLAPHADAAPTRGRTDRMAVIAAVPRRPHRLARVRPARTPQCCCDVGVRFGGKFCARMGSIRSKTASVCAAGCRRLGYGGDGFWTADGPIPAMRVTASTKPSGYPDSWEAWNRRTDWRERYSNSPARRRGRQKRQPRN